MNKSLLLKTGGSFFMSVAICILTIACQEKAPKQITMAPSAVPDSAKHRFTASMVDNKKDPNCGMPVTAGIMDTIHYNGKVYGFCSDECRDAFLKDPVAMAKITEMK